MVSLEETMARTERFELPRHKVTGFQIRRDTRLCDVRSELSSQPLFIKQRVATRCADDGVAQ